MQREYSHEAKKQQMNEWMQYPAQITMQNWKTRRNQLHKTCIKRCIHEGEEGFDTEVFKDFGARRKQTRKLTGKKPDRQLSAKKCHSWVNKNLHATMTGTTHAIRVQWRHTSVQYPRKEKCTRKSVAISGFKDIWKIETVTDSLQHDNHCPKMN